jgi:hypothetical protein
MKHDHKRAKKPEHSATFLSKVHLGTTSHAKYPLVQTICNNIEPPKKQFERATRLYPNEPIRRCQEWTADAIQALKSGGILET